MTPRGPAKRVTIIVGESDRHHHRPVYAEIVHRAHEAGLAGASVFRGMEGFGASSRIHTSRLLSLSQDLPMAVIVVDTAAAVERFLPLIDDLIDDGIVLVDDVTVYRPTGRSPGAADPAHTGSSADPGSHAAPNSPSGTGGDLER
jgi:uncharacterized protein